MAYIDQGTLVLQFSSDLSRFITYARSIGPIIPPRQVLH